MHILKPQALSICLILLCLSFTGCLSRLSLAAKLTETDYAEKQIYRDSRSKKDFLEVQQIIRKKCPCTDVIARKFEDGRQVYTLWYGCNYRSTQKVLKTFSKSGTVTETKMFDPVYDSSFTEPLTELDKLVLARIDSFRLVDKPIKPENRLCEKKITGFRPM